MYVCLCKGITDKMLDESIKSQGGNISQGLKALGVGSECGTCLHQALENSKWKTSQKNQKFQKVKAQKSK